MAQFVLIEDGGVTAPSGFLAGVAATGMKHSGAYDVALLVSEHDCAAAAVFTQNQLAAAPVIVDRQVLLTSRERVRGVVANAKYANAGTGAPGLRAARLMQQQTATLLDLEPDQFFVLSTGVIGQPLPLDKIGAGIEICALNLSADNGAAAAQAIMTTDTVLKQVAVRFEIDGVLVTLGGMAKGAGMIHPNMATMLGVITTDIAAPSDLLQMMLSRAVDSSFNCISVDGDTSTNDTVLLLANGAAGVELSGLQLAKGIETFEAALNFVCLTLAQMIVRDGEGATKFIEIQVEGAATDDDAGRIANAIATSPLVKTAFAGGDANWGRIVAAAGNAGVALDAEQLTLWFSSDGEQWLQVFADGLPAQYAEEQADAIFAGDEITIRLRIGAGGGKRVMWTCDLSSGYIAVNADYRS